MMRTTIATVALMIGSTSAFTSVRLPRELADISSDVVDVVGQQAVQADLLQYWVGAGRRRRRDRRRRVTPSPTSSPTRPPTQSPTVSPTVAPTESPTPSPTLSPTESPTASPTPSPTESPTPSPTLSPTESPTASPTPSPTQAPTAVPTAAPTTCAESGTCSIYEDPHIKIFDGLTISLLGTTSAVKVKDAYGSGDMWLVRSTDISIQARYLPEPGLPAENLFVRAIAIGGAFLKGNTLILGPLDKEITWNGRSILKLQTSKFEAPVGEGKIRAQRSLKSHLVEDMTQSNPGVDIEMPLGVNVTLNRLGKHVNLFINMPPAEGGQDGLCGNFNCNPFDDSLQMIMHGRSPKVRASESLFPTDY